MQEKKQIDFAKPVRHLVGIAFFFVIAITCTQVIARYVFNHSIIWSEETVRFLVVWMCMVGSAVSNFDDSHMTINFIVEKFPRPVQFAFYTVRQIMIIGFCVIGSYFSLSLIKAAGSDPVGAIPVPAYAWRISGTVGLAVMALFTLIRWTRDFRKFTRGEFCLLDAEDKIETNETIIEAEKEIEEAEKEAEAEKAGEQKGAVK